MGKVIESNLILEDYPETPLTLEQGLKLLGVKEVPGDRKCRGSFSKV